MMISVNGVLCRENTWDANTVKEIKRCYSLLNVAGKRVCDIGANIGAFTVSAVQQQADVIHSFEPFPETFEMLKLNCDKFNNVELYNYAVALESGETYIWYIPGGTHSGGISTKIKRGRSPMRVPTIGFQYVLGICRPDVLKVDVEGAEYDWLYGDQLPPWVTQVAVELHLNRRAWRHLDAPTLVHSFRDWETLREPKLTGKNWTTMGVWRR